MAEIWKPIPEFPGYEVSDHGQVRSWRTYDPSGTFACEPHLLKTPPDRGYPCVDLHRDGRSHTKRVHRLVALVFLGPRPEGLQVCHYDGDKANNHISNLRYDSAKGNVADAIRHGTIAYPPNSYARKRQKEAREACEQESE